MTVIRAVIPAHRRFVWVAIWMIIRAQPIRIMRQPDFPQSAKRATIPQGGIRQTGIMISCIFRFTPGSIEMSGILAPTAMWIKITLLFSSAFFAMRIVNQRWMMNTMV